MVEWRPVVVQGCTRLEGGHCHVHHRYGPSNGQSGERSVVRAVVDVPQGRTGCAVLMTTQPGGRSAGVLAREPALGVQALDGYAHYQHGQEKSLHHKQPCPQCT